MKTQYLNLVKLSLNKTKYRNFLNDSSKGPHTSVETNSPGIDVFGRDANGKRHAFPYTHGSQN